MHAIRQTGRPRAGIRFRTADDIVLHLDHYRPALAPCREVDRGCVRVLRDIREGLDTMK
jgi:hypothetical protein